MKLIPPIPVNHRSKAEEKIFDALRGSKMGGYCFHSVVLARHEFKREGEADFLILTPTGIFVLEIKGGLVERLENGMWKFTAKDGRSNEKTESPFDQARTALYSIRKELVDRFGKNLLKFAWGYGVAFPDIEFGSKSPEWDSAYVMDSRDMKNPIDEYLHKMIRYWQRSGKAAEEMDNETLQKIASYIRGSFGCIRSFKLEISETEEQLLRLTEEQYIALDAMDINPRVIFQGLAGTGKTCLAIEKARRNAGKQIKTLFICYNRLLAGYLSQLIEKEKLTAFITVDSLYGYFYRKIKAAGMVTELQSKYPNKDFLFREGYPSFFLEAVKNDPPEFAELIIDEGQDLLFAENIAALDASFKGGFAEGSWSLFLDPERQSGVFNRFDGDLLKELTGKAAVYRLTINCRNTLPIATQAELVSDLPLGKVLNEFGPDVSYSWYENDFDQSVSVSEAVNDMLSKGIEPSSIVILSVEPYSGSLAASGRLRLDCPTYELTEESVTRPVPGAIPCGSVLSYKGLESSIVILTDITGLDGDKIKSLNYVGFTRARTSLWVFLRKDLQKVYRGMLAKTLAKGG